MLGPTRVLSFDSYPGQTIPLDANGDLRVSFKNLPRVYQAVSAADILASRIDRELLDITWALVSYTASALIDIVPTPYNGGAPGVEVQARILGCILDNHVPYTPRASTLLMVLLAAAVAGVL